MSTYSTEPHAMPHGLQQGDPDVGHGPSSASSDKASPLSNLNFFKSLNPEKKQTKDGQPPKRRGPKPDSKPALTRRQELNRQAQRTHRERKELYIKALEQEVLRLKEVFAETNREKNEVLAENRRLKELLAQHGISYDFGTSPIKFSRENSRYGPSSSGSISGSYQIGSDSTGFSPPPPAMSAHAQNMAAVQANQMRSMAQLPSNRLDYDSIGIDFVLTLERPCMDHMQYLMVRSHNQKGQTIHHPMENPDDAEHEHMSGHALMQTAPPYSHLKEKPADIYPHQMPVGIDNGALTKLMQLSSRLPLDREGEITPVMAWSMIYGHERVGQLEARDIELVKQNLAAKVRCYGFGAVVEEFEVHDALDTLFAEKDSTAVPALGHAMAAQQIKAH
ncbi:hypothetical protein DOTSEDRAFT_164596 [Dothistroma septosporum NZE10]|uniref:BZIP domain-containing protein n=1 Tax=Dothistroma septosporum (strain NZE10 / CBS 128990) TaxID=675120 RepID=N1Q4Z0_DOTSN|nr:hypothetical protein DOTSEDRAFT_164596 [Dothistroma septosporum NZE10]